MFLSSAIVRWAIGQLRENCHPFLGISFLAGKQSGMPVGTTATMSLDAATKSHMEKYHRLDPKSEFYFQPFKSKRRRYWVAANYSSSGLQAINTQTFKDVFLHPRNTRQWGLAEGYIGIVNARLWESPGHGPASLAAVAIWLGKMEQWDSNTTIESIVKQFRLKFGISDEEIAKLFQPSILPPQSMAITSDKVLDLKSVAYEFAIPPDAPSQAEGTLTSVHISHVGPAKELFLEFGERLTLIAGDNGLGKTFLLDGAWWALTGTWAGHPAYPFPSARTKKPRIQYKIQNSTGQEIAGETTFNWKNHTWQHLGKQPSVAALSIYTRVDGSFAVADRTRGRLQAGEQSSLSFFTEREVWEGKAGEIEGLIRDWVSWQLSSDTGPFTMLTRVLEHLSPADLGLLVPGEPVRIPGDPRKIPTINHVYGHVPVLFASAGVQRVLLLAYLIIWSWQEHLLASQHVGVSPQRRMVVIIDELEAHLHPKWQRIVLPGLMSIGKLLSEELEIQVIASTHSPMVLASVEEEFSGESDRLAHLSLENGSVNLERLDFYKYGDMSSWLMSPVFGLRHARSQAAEETIEKAKLLQLSDEPSLEDIRQVTLCLKKTLAPDDTFWSRWIYFARQFGDDI